jgi:hypothetical protein
MNCKKGEMALIIKGSSNEGKIVSCLEFIGNTIPGFPPLVKGLMISGRWIGN